jgi:hypothetical protein
MDFSAQASKVITDALKDISAGETGKTIVSDTHLDVVIKGLKKYILTFYLGLDMMWRLDSLKTMKAALNNDFSALKRASTNVSTSTSEEMNNIHMFLSTTLVISNNLKKDISGVTK